MANNGFVATLLQASLEESPTPTLGICRAGNMDALSHTRQKPWEYFEQNYCGT
jgi:hypothetical protein